MNGAAAQDRPFSPRYMHESSFILGPFLSDVERLALSAWQRLALLVRPEGSVASQEPLRDFALTSDLLFRRKVDDVLGVIVGRVLDTVSAKQHKQCAKWVSKAARGQARRLLSNVHEALCYGRAGR